MSEVHIRINKKVFERTIFTLIIIGLLIFMFVSSDSQQVDTQELDQLQEQITNLTQENSVLQEEITTLQTQNQQLQDELEEVPEPVQEEEQEEPALSGDLDISYDAVMRNDRLDRFVVAINNGLEVNQRLTIRINWEGLTDGGLVKVEEVTVDSGSSETVIFDGDNALISTPPPGTDEIRISITDADGQSVVQDWVQVN